MLGRLNQLHKLSRANCTYIWQLVVSATLLVARRTNNRKVVGSMPANGVCITVGRPPLLLPSCNKLEFKTVSVDGLGSAMGKW